MCVGACGRQGNDGDEEEAAHTVGSPATCKNCLTVGASQSDERDVSPPPYAPPLHPSTPPPLTHSTATHDVGWQSEPQGSHGSLGLMWG
jgi:hypothetical protein